MAGGARLLLELFEQLDGHDAADASPIEAQQRPVLLGNPQLGKCSFSSLAHGRTPLAGRSKIPRPSRLSPGLARHASVSDATKRMCRKVGPSGLPLKPWP